DSTIVNQGILVTSDQSSSKIPLVISQKKPSREDFTLHPLTRLPYHQPPVLLPLPPLILTTFPLQVFRPETHREQLISTLSSSSYCSRIEKSHTKTQQEREGMAEQEAVEKQGGRGQWSSKYLSECLDHIFPILVEHEDGHAEGAEFADASLLTGYG
ncbi:MAG: hypothetical protein Q9216_002529, partial [Gyalolechia sp. 2 TL-2023]